MARKETVILCALAESRLGVLVTEGEARATAMGLRHAAQFGARERSRPADHPAAVAGL